MTSIAGDYARHLCLFLNMFCQNMHQRSLLASGRKIFVYEHDSHILEPELQKPTAVPHQHQSMQGCKTWHNHVFCARQAVLSNPNITQRHLRKNFVACAMLPAPNNLKLERANTFFGEMRLSSTEGGSKKLTLPSLWYFLCTLGSA